MITSVNKTFLNSKDQDLQKLLILYEIVKVKK
jgi:hypothetical protein